MAADILLLILVNFCILAVIFGAAWGLSVRLKDASIVDVLWGPACALPAVVTYITFSTADPRSAILAALAAVWATRLAVHLGQRNFGHGEDYRYAAMRRKQGDGRAFAEWSLVNVFTLQCTIAWFVSLPVQIGQIGGSGTLGIAGVVGVILFAVGFGFEAIGDYQLRAFKRRAENRGKLMTHGLWSITRHPNYFGDCCVWWGLYLIAAESAFGWITILSPVLMTYLLINVSGKKLLERRLRKTYPEYEAYARRVSGFIPLPPRRSVQTFTSGSE